MKVVTQSLGTEDRYILDYKNFSGDGYTFAIKTSQKGEITIEDVLEVGNSEPDNKVNKEIGKKYESIEKIV